MFFFLVVLFLFEMLQLQLFSWEFRIALSGGDRGQFSSVVVTLSCTSKTVLVTGAEACGVVWAGCLVFLFFLSDCPGLFLLGVLLERDRGQDSVVSVALFCFSIDCKRTRSLERGQILLSLHSSLVPIHHKLVEEMFH